MEIASTYFILNGIFYQHLAREKNRESNKYRDKHLYINHDKIYMIINYVYLQV